MRNMVGLFYGVRKNTMQVYPKKILSIEQQIQSYIDAGMDVSPREETEKALRTIGYYRLRGYLFHLYDNDAKKFLSDIKFSDVLSLYRFDTALSRLIFSMVSAIEVALRARLNEALLAYGDPLVLNDPTVFEDKNLYWKNAAKIASEIARSSDVFIKHHFSNHDGQIPLWAAVEVMSFGTLSKTVKNLKTDRESVYYKLAEYYKFRTSKGRMKIPNKRILTSWIYSVYVLRNMCAHNSRIYNRAITASPMLISNDQIVPQPRFNGLYQIMLAMKYLRPTDETWTDFVSEFKHLISAYSAVIDLRRMNFPSDWEHHFAL